MPTSQWHKFYTSHVAAPPGVLFELLADMPAYGRWLPGSQQFGKTTDVEPYPVQLGSRYHDGKPDEPGKDWWGTVTGFQPPGSLDFHHTIPVPQPRATVDVHIHYSFELENVSTRMTRWLVLDISMPTITQPPPQTHPQQLRKREPADHGCSQEIRRGPHRRRPQ
jgi:hypothetical protein